MIKKLLDWLRNRWRISTTSTYDKPLYIPIDECFNEEVCKQFLKKHNIAVKAPTDPDYFVGVFWGRTRECQYFEWSRIITNVSRHDRRIRSFVSIRTPTPDDLKGMQCCYNPLQDSLGEL